MEKLSAKDICAIIKACKDSKVKKIKFGDLELDLSSEVSEIPAVENVNASGMFQIPNQVNEAQRLADLLVSDPQAYEEELKKLDEAS